MFKMPFLFHFLSVFFQICEEEYCLSLNVIKYFFLYKIHAAPMFTLNFPKQ